MKTEFLISVTPPCECTAEQLKEWVEFCTGYCASIDNSNPLSEFDMEADSCSEY